MPVKFQRTTKTGDRFDNPHERSYHRFAAAAFEQFMGRFHYGIVSGRHELFEPYPPARELVEWYARVLRREHELVAGKELDAIQPILVPEQRAPLLRTITDAKLAARTANWNARIDHMPRRDQLRDGKFVAHRSTGRTLVGCAWLNLPDDVPASSSKRAITAYLTDGIPTLQAAKKVRIEHRVDRAKAAFLDFVRSWPVSDTPLSWNVVTRGGLPFELSVDARVEQGIRAVWMRSEFREYQATRDLDWADVALRLAATGNLFPLILEGMRWVPTRPRNRAALDAVSGILISSAKRRVAELMAEQVRRGIAVSPLPEGGSSAQRQA